MWIVKIGQKLTKRQQVQIFGFAVLLVNVPTFSVFRAIPNRTFFLWRCATAPILVRFHQTYIHAHLLTYTILKIGWDHWVQSSELESLPKVHGTVRVNWIRRFCHFAQFARLCDETHPGKIVSHPPQDQGLSPHSSVFGFEHFWFS